MSSKFVRNITGTKIKGDLKEPLYTNQQNDLLSDDEDVAVRNGNDYHLLTDNIKEIKSANNSLKVHEIDKNTVELEVSQTESVETKITSSNDELLEVVKKDVNEFELQPKVQDLSEYATKEEVTEQIENIDIPEINLEDYATLEYVNNKVGNIEEYVNQKINDIEIPDPDLTNYVQFEDLSDYSTNEYTQNKINESETQTKQYITNEIAKIPEPDLTEYATEKYVDDEIEKIINKNEKYYVVSSRISKIEPEEIRVMISVYDLVNNVYIKNPLSVMSVSDFNTNYSKFKFSTVSLGYNFIYARFNLEEENDPLTETQIMNIRKIGGIIKYTINDYVFHEPVYIGGEL